MNNSYVAPTYKADGFYCPICKHYAHQMWYRVYIDPKCRDPYLPDFSPKENYRIVQSRPSYVGAAHGYPVESKQEYESIDDIALSVCQKCNAKAIWVKDKLVHPLQSTAPYPNEDMPDDAKADFMEAREIVDKSPKAAAALLRLALQKLTIYFGGDPKKNLNINIHVLVQKGLPPIIQQSFDILRIVGNDAVHPGVIDVDNKETAMMLFNCLNVIVDSMITKQKNIDEFYNSLPQDKLNAVKKRDSRA